MPNRKILYVVPHMPCPPTMGAHRRVLYIGRQLRQCGEVTLVYVGTHYSEESLEATRSEFGNVVLMRPRSIERRGLMSRFRYKLGYHWPWHYEYKVSRSDRRRFEQLHREHNLVWFHTLSAADCFGTNAWERSVMDLDDLNQSKFALKSQFERGIRSAIANTLLVYKWRRRERQSLDRYSAITVCSHADKTLLGNRDHIYVLPNGFENPPVEPTRCVPQSPRLGFIGNLAYGPNADGLKWFSSEVWPLITRQVPHACLRIVGRVPEQGDYLNQPGYETLGFLEDTNNEFASWSAMIVPLRYGGGTRLKILEAFSRKCPVISTSVGAYGLEVTDDKDILLEDSPQAFANQCVRMLQEPDLGQSLAEAGWKLFQTKYTWDVIGNSIQNVVEEVTGKRSPS